MEIIARIGALAAFISQPLFTQLVPSAIVYTCEEVNDSEGV